MCVHIFIFNLKTNNFHNYHCTTDERKQGKYGQSDHCSPLVLLWTGTLLVSFKLHLD